jgi:dTDP-4-dehydrorhamnose reductase
MTRILVTGSKGQLGHALKSVLADEEALFTDLEEMDITNFDQVEAVFSEFKPEFLVHGAAYTNVDGAEIDTETAEKVNATGTKNLAEACRKHGTKLIYISTDYVFDGSGDKPYLHDDQTNPKTVYGKTKLGGEGAVKDVPKWWILRTSWLYGEGGNFVRTMLNLAKENQSLKITGDQYGRPTSADDLAKAILNVIKKQPEIGIYHVTGDGPIVSWAEFAQKIFDLSNLKVAVTGRTTEDYVSEKEKEGKRIAPRPKYSALDLEKTKAAGLYVSDWEKSLRKYLEKKVKNGRE